MTPAPADINAALDQVRDPASGKGMIESGRAAPPRVTDGTVSVVLDVTVFATRKRQ